MTHPPAPERRPGPLDPAAYARLFEGAPDGPAVLAELERIFVSGAKLDGGIDAVLTTYHRMGARSVVEFIVRKINMANGVPADDHVQ